MTYQPVGSLGWENVTTTEQLSGRTIDGTASYVKLVKRTGAAGTGDVAFAHGITGLTRLVTIKVMCKDSVPQWIHIPEPDVSNGTNVFGLSVSWDSTNITVHIGTSWTSTNALAELWCIMEYLK